MEESILSVIQSLSDECLARSIDATPALIAYTVRSVISSKIEEFQMDVSKPLDSQKVQMLKNETMKLIHDSESIPMQTIRMQVDMDLGLAQLERSTKQKEEREKDHRESIEKELITTRARSSTAIEALYRKIVSYSIISSGWGSPNDPQCVRQASAAMEQVFPVTELSRFLGSSDDDKKNRLSDLSKNVLGVRVFQTFGGDLADPSTNLRLEVPKKISQLRERITTSIEGVNSLLIEYNNVLKDQAPINSEEEEKESEHRRRLTDELANRQQFLFFLELLMTRLKDTSQLMEKAVTEFDSLIENLRGLMEVSESVPTQKAMPFFSALSEVWTRLKACEESVKGLETLLSRLRKHRDTFTYSIGEATDSVKSSPTRPVDSKPEIPRENIPKESEILTDDSHPVIIQRETDGEFAFNGFCPVTLVERDGLLLPGDVVLGSIKWEKRYYAFVDQEKRSKFLENPEKWHMEALEVARRKPELVPLLGLQNEFPHLQAPKIPIRASQPKPKESKYRDSEIQTEVHPVESYIDRTYHWNQWELMKRKKILKSLENKRTKSGQTDASHFRRESQAQTYAKKEKGEQTMTETGTSMPRNVRYIAGLRGDSMAKAKVVTMTLDLH